jgi:hypothetical protein
MQSRALAKLLQPTETGPEGALAHSGSNSVCLLLDAHLKSLNIPEDNADNSTQYTHMHHVRNVLVLEGACTQVKRITPPPAHATGDTAHALCVHVCHGAACSLACSTHQSGCNRCNHAPVCDCKASIPAVGCCCLMHTASSCTTPAGRGAPWSPSRLCDRAQPLIYQRHQPQLHCSRCHIIITLPIRP